MPLSGAPSLPWVGASWIGAEQWSEIAPAIGHLVDHFRPGLPLFEEKVKVLPRDSALAASGEVLRGQTLPQIANALEGILEIFDPSGLVWSVGAVDNGGQALHERLDVLPDSRELRPSIRERVLSESQDLVQEFDLVALLSELLLRQQALLIADGLDHEREVVPEAGEGDEPLVRRELLSPGLLALARVASDAAGVEQGVHEKLLVQKAARALLSR